MWSPLEYACHVHDVHQLFHERLTAMLTEDRAALRQLGPGHHGGRARGTTSRCRPSSGRRWSPRRTPSATSTPRSPATTWDRTGVRSDGAVFTVATLGRYHYHDVFHHLHDVAALAERVTVGVVRRVRRRLRRRHQRDARRACAGNIARFVGAVGPGARVLEIGSGPRAATPLALEQIGLSVRRTDISPGVRAAARAGRATSPTSVDPLRDDLDRPAARRCAVRRRSGPTRRCSTSAREPAGRAAPAGGRHPRRRHPAHDPQGGRRRALVGARARRRAAVLHLLARGRRCATCLVEAGWDVDEVRRGESDPVDRPSEAWLAVFATRV